VSNGWMLNFHWLSVNWASCCCRLMGFC
jgi:hypothetical protein